MGELVVTTEEVAEAEFLRYCKSFRLDVDESAMDREDLKSFHREKRRIIVAIQEGRLTVDDEGQPILTPEEGGEPIVFYKPRGKDAVAMDRHVKGKDASKGFAMLASITRRTERYYDQLLYSDTLIMQSVLNLFLG